MKRAPSPSGAPAACRTPPAGRPPARLLRLRVWLRRWRLDRELADGLPWETGAARALRAAQLAGMPTRRRVARSLLRLVAEVQGTPVATVSASSAVPPCRAAVRPWCEALTGLAERLEHGGAVSPRGVARALVLLCDGASPLFNPASERSVAEAIWWIADGLQASPRRGAGAGTPILMKSSRPAGRS
jgi:hypothetical protein